ncbi:hypothetical protein ABPG74_000602 [Tetrahymena malaccensis]
MVNGGCPFSKDPQHKITPVILGSHLAALNLGLMVAYLADFKLVSSSLNILAFSLLACLVAVQLKKFLGVEFKYSKSSSNEQQSAEASCCKIDFNNPESIKGLYIHLYTWINNGVQRFRKIVLLQDKLYTLKWLSILYFATKVAYFLGDFGFLFVASNVACVAPYVLQNHSEQIKGLYQTVKDLVTKQVSALADKIPGKAKTA